MASQGETVDEALANLREALELFFEDDEVPAAFDHPLVTSIEIRIPALPQVSGWQVVRAASR
ncbi:MAG: type II toxin-antitoxin system HicB family antitoxin [Pseudonocardia sp.]|nr:type II toxin-antitoxin system HicB family antitoxin [Pseudonocardia sp.]